jgi:hypothetical protein
MLISGLSWIWFRELCIWNMKWVLELWNVRKLPGFNVCRNVLIVDPEYFNAVSFCVRESGWRGEGEEWPRESNSMSVRVSVCVCVGERERQTKYISALSDTCKFMQIFFIYHLIFQLISVNCLHKICNKISGNMLNVKVLAHRKFVSCFLNCVFLIFLLLSRQKTFLNLLYLLLLTELSPSWEAANCAATQELPSIDFPQTKPKMFVCKINWKQLWATWHRVTWALAVRSRL